MEILSSLFRPAEFLALLKFKLGKSPILKPQNLNKECESHRQCYKFLNQTSRSFAAVIQALDDKVQDAVCIFYLVLRALDTVEDDMSIPLHVKIPMLKGFYKNLNDPHWNYTQSKEKDKVVLEEFPVISLEFRKLPQVQQDIISYICKEMGQGMSEYLDGSVITLQQWDEYCHYVAGLVGIGLSKLFSSSALEAENLGDETQLANSMGLFLQKTNIIRDYLEDVNDQRQFWPQEVWKKYCRKLPELKETDMQGNALNCLNELVNNALQHIPECIKYLSMLSNQSVFNFCAIPQVMAIATLERCYNNPNVFKGVVKIRKGEAVQLMMEATDINRVKAIMVSYLKKIQNRIPVKQHNTAETTKVATQTALDVCKTDVRFSSGSTYLPVYMSLGLLLYAIISQYCTDSGLLRAIMG